MRKAEMLKHWTNLPPRPIQMRSVPYKHTGSTYDQDGIRLTGSRDFIDSILSRLKELLERENGMTRLQVSYQEAKDKDTGRSLGSWCCYVQVHQRGREAIIANAIFEGARA